MECSLEGSNARIIAKAIQSLSKVGKELFIEADSDGLQMRTINSTQSAMGSMRFHRSMFNTFYLPPGGDCTCKITMKACLGVFRNMKQVEHCELKVLANRTKFQVKLRCKLETMKQALISIVDEQNITTAVAADNSPNIIRGDHKLFMEISNSFNSAEEELTLEAQTDSLTAKNYVEGARVNDKFMRSQLKLKPTEFEHYQVAQGGTVITFCIKEFRAFLLFAEALNAELTLEFDDAGSPFFVKIQKHREIECLLILSTLSPEDVSFSEDYCQREMSVHEQSNGAQKRKSSTPGAGSALQQKRHMATMETTLSSTDGDASLFQFPERPARTANANSSVRRAANETNLNSTANASQTQTRQPHSGSHTDVPSIPQARLLLEGDTVDLADSEADEEALLLAAADAAEASQPTSIEVCFFNTEDVPSTQVPSQAADENDDDEIIPQSPERDNNKMRTIFSRCFQNTYVPREPSPNSQIYAANSDAED
ncbi:Rad9 [Drosophila busckii]|uniref:Cell cycle checkpoint control protein n=1 Tax=Drosophila busckii TaxID=30019 RepID=A0A0M4EHB9_DROBS|nr:cell cycle checkpoint control protein RAD9A [Drosophila busckii]ALC45708.1 Rad9 [Drosophila busckii]